MREKVEWNNQEGHKTSSKDECCENCQTCAFSLGIASIDSFNETGRPSVDLSFKEIREQEYC